VLRLRTYPCPGGPDSGRSRLERGRCRSVCSGTRSGTELGNTPFQSDRFPGPARSLEALSLTPRIAGDLRALRRVLSPGSDRHPARMVSSDGTCSIEIEVRYSEGIAIGAIAGPPASPEDGLQPPNRCSLSRTRYFLPDPGRCPRRSGLAGAGLGTTAVAKPMYADGLSFPELGLLPWPPSRRRMPRDCATRSIEPVRLATALRRCFERDRAGLG
jgi:hypothetical protein